MLMANGKANDKYRCHQQKNLGREEEVREKGKLRRRPASFLVLHQLYAARNVCLALTDTNTRRPFSNTRVSATRVECALSALCTLLYSENTFTCWVMLKLYMIASVLENILAKEGWRRVWPTSRGAEDEWFHSPERGASSCSIK